MSAVLDVEYNSINNRIKKLEAPVTAITLLRVLFIFRQKKILVARRFIEEVSDGIDTEQ